MNRLGDLRMLSLDLHLRLMAEKAGFEPAIRFRRIHAFQACLFNHSSISPYNCAQDTKNECKIRKVRQLTKENLKKYYYDARKTRF